MPKSLKVLFLILITGTVMYAQTVEKPKPNQPVLEIGHPNQVSQAYGVNSITSGGSAWESN